MNDRADITITDSSGAPFAILSLVVHRDRRRGFEGAFVRLPGIATNGGYRAATNGRAFISERELLPILRAAHKYPSVFNPRPVGA